MIQPFTRRTPSLSGAGTRFSALFGGSLNWSTGVAVVNSPAPAAGTLSNFKIELITAPGVGITRTYTVYVNGSPTAITVSISGTDTTGQDITNSVAINADDLVAVGSTESGGTAAASQVDIAIELETADDFTSAYSASYSALPSSDAQANFNITGSPSTAGNPGTADDGESLWPIDGNFTRTTVQLQTAPGVGNSRIFRLRVDNVLQDGSGATVDTTITIAHPATAGTATFTLPVTAGQLVCWDSIGTSTPAGTNWSAGAAFVASTANEFAICVSESNAVASGAPSYSGAPAISWDATESDIHVLAPITPFVVTGIRIMTSVADNGRTVQTRVGGVSSGPLATLGGGGTTASGSGTVTVNARWSVVTTPGTTTPRLIYGLNGNVASQATPGPLTSSPLLRQARVGGGMVQ